MVCRFYGFSLGDMMAMTLRQFGIMLNEISNILKLEVGDDEQKETSLTGNAGFNLARTILPRRKK